MPCHQLCLSPFLFGTDHSRLLPYLFSEQTHGGPCPSPCQAACPCPCPCPSPCPSPCHTRRSSRRGFPPDHSPRFPDNRNPMHTESSQRIPPSRPHLSSASRWQSDLHPHGKSRC